MMIRSFKLMTGDELIATLTGAGDGKWTIRKPLALRVIQGPNGQPALALTPWSPMQHEEAEHVLFTHGLVAEPSLVSDGAQREYLRQTTGIELPSVSSAILKG